MCPLPCGDAGSTHHTVTLTDSDRHRKTHTTVAQINHQSKNTKSQISIRSGVQLQVMRTLLYTGARTEEGAGRRPSLTQLSLSALRALSETECSAHAAVSCKAKRAVKNKCFPSLSAVNKVLRLVVCSLYQPIDAFSHPCVPKPKIRYTERVLHTGDQYALCTELLRCIL